MATMTATILVGTAHPNDGGINPSHFLFLSENSRPAWMLVPQNIIEHEYKKELKKVTWIPTLEHMLEDALVMIGLYVLKDAEIIQLFKKHFIGKNRTFISLYEDIPTSALEQMYGRMQQLTTDVKVVVSVFNGSSIMKNISIVKDYPFDIEVCPTSFRREYNQWTRKTEEAGVLEDGAQKVTNMWSAR
ncbi:hypothetical protein [Aneurinibacillus tyrosinisolvens]|uniref:hypothetical protein n=1 Tax=Aneurinibacillus tyrosinisolvens TaxID=1443435 RepID=UPI00069AF80E|nr:hypothetical protein [Aneurinibacillus tyrosinisolvens]